MVMASLSEKLWSLNSLQNGKMKNNDDHVFGNLDRKVLSPPVDKKGKNWKLLIDPFIKGKTHEKVVRYGGTLDGPDQLPVPLRDPRDTMTPVRRTKEVDFIVPKFKYNKWSVGTPPLKSIFIYGLNDNVNQEFLTNLFEPLGQIEQLKVYYHPKTRKHLGIAFVSFARSSVTQEVLAKYHGTSIMGNIVNIKPDPLCQITKKVLDKLIRGQSEANIPEIIQSVQLRSHHKTAAYAFRHNERSQNYYTARGKVRKSSESIATPRPEERPPQQQNGAPAPEDHTLHLEQVSPKMDTPPETEISPIRPEDDAKVLEEQFDKGVKRAPAPPDEHKHKIPKPAEFGLSPTDEKRRDARLSEMDKERRQAHSDRKWEEWKMRTELQIRTEKTNRYVKEHCGGNSRSEKYPPSSEKYPPSSDKYPPSSDKYPPSSEKYTLPSDIYPPSSDKYPLPSDKYPLPSDKYPLPSDKYSLPSDKYSLPSDKYPLPSDKYPLPSDKYPLPSDKYPLPSDKYPLPSDKYYHMSERDRYYAHYPYYDKHYAKDHRYKESSSRHRSSKYDKYDKYTAEKYKYYDHHRGIVVYPVDYKRSSYEKLHKSSSKSSKEYEKYENTYDHRSGSPLAEHVVRSDGTSSHLTSPTADKHRGEPEKVRSKSRLCDEQYLVDRVSKRKRSKSPFYHKSPALAEPPKAASPKIGSATSHDTGYASISPVPGSPPKPDLDISTQSENPYGCARAVPRKHIAKVKLIGMKSETGEMSSSSMSLEEESGGEEQMRVEDISPNTTPKEPPVLLPPPPHPEPPPIQLPNSLPPIPLLPVPPVPPVLPVQYQAGQWLHTTFPPDMYAHYDYDYNPEEAADILARQEAAEKAAAKQREAALFKERRTNSLNLLLSLMENVLSRDIKIKLNEKVAFAHLEVVWNEEEDKKKKEEEELLAKKKQEQAALSDSDPVTTKAPDMPSLSEMRSLSDAKQTSYNRQASITFKVPKLNRGMRPQVIVKKMPLPLPKEEEEESQSEEDVDEEELVAKRKHASSRYNTIYSSSSSSSESEVEEEEEEEEEESMVAEVKSTVAPELVLPAPVPAKYAPRMEEEEELILEQLFRDELSEEDKILFKRAYDILMKESPELLADVTWLSPPELPNTSRRRQTSVEHKHRTGCARTEAFYCMSKEEKFKLKLANLNKSGAMEHLVTAPQPAKKVDAKATARSTRATQRRQATHYFDIPEVQLLQLTTRRKMVKFKRSDIHDWGLFALEAISADEMVIEYVGEVVREIIANIRERRYEEEGIGSSYLFRIDQTSYIVDATHRGSISRFINHNCDPNCYARVISVGTKKKIVIYSKRDIAAEEEITYDYKFAIEEEANKIPCLCNSPACRGFLN